MATHHRGAGQPWDKDATPNGKDTDVNIQNNYHHEDAGDFEPIGQENHANLANLTQELDELHHRVQAREDQQAEALECIEQELQRISLAFYPSVPPEPLDNVLRQYMDTLCSVQREMTFTNTLLQDITIFTGNDATQLEDWLLDVETADDLSAESRTKLAQAKPRGLTCTLITEALYFRPRVGKTLRIYCI